MESQVNLPIGVEPKQFDLLAARPDQRDAVVMEIMRVLVEHRRHAHLGALATSEDEADGSFEVAHAHQGSLRDRLQAIKRGDVQDGALSFLRDRTSVVSGKRVSVRVDHGGRRIIKKKKKQQDIWIFYAQTIRNRLKAHSY